MRNKGDLYILSTALLWSTSGVLIKFIAGTPIAINGLRSLIAFLFFAAMNRSFRFKLNKLIVLAAMSLTLTNLLYVTAVKMTGAANAITLQYLAPLFVLIWQSLYEKKLPSLTKTLCILMAFAGMVIFFYDSLGSGKMLGNVVAVMAGLCFSGVFFINSLEGSSSADASMLGFLLSFVIAIPFLSGFENQNTASVIALVFLGVFQVGLAYYLYSKGSKLTSALNASLISLLEIVLNPLWVFLVFGEKVSMMSMFGAFIIVSAVVINAIMEAKK